MTLSIDGWTGNARLSACGTYRYELSREWQDGEGSVLFIMLNPSTADANANDPTIRRCMGFARAWGCRRLEIRNLFAYRATDPADMVAAHMRRVDIVGPENNRSIEVAASEARNDYVIVAWGAHRLADFRGRDVLELFRRPPFCLGVSKSGAPKHPLYIPADFAPIEYRGRL
jgi:hypothetical protein